MTTVIHCYIVFTEDICMKIILNNSSMIPIYQQLIDQIKNHIIDGTLKENEILPSVRSLSGQLRISSLTVKKAYDNLEEDGFVQTVHGKGTFVLANENDIAVEARRAAVEADFVKAIEKAKLIGMSNEEIMDTINILLEE